MQMLVYENYNKFISATDTIQAMKTKVLFSHHAFGREVLFLFVLPRLGGQYGGRNGTADNEHQRNHYGKRLYEDRHDLLF